MAESGYALEHDFSATADVNFALRWPANLRPFARMAREDTQVKSVLKAVGLPVRRTQWRVVPDGADDDVTRLVSEDLNLPIIGEEALSVGRSRIGHVSFQEHLHWCLKQLVFGHAFFEVVFKEVDGRDRLHKLAYRPPATISKIGVSRDGGLEFIEQFAGPGDKTNVKIPVEHLLGYVNDPDDFSWTGTSELRAAYKHWVIRDRLLTKEEMIIDRNGMGIPWYEASPVGDERELKRGREMAQKVRSGKYAGGAGPNGSKLSLVGVSGQLVSPREAIAYHDSMIARSVLAHFLNLEGKGGSYSLAEIQAETFIQSLQTLAEGIADTINRILIPRMVNLAFDTDHGPYPKLTFDPIGSKKELSMGALATLATAGIILPDRDLEDEVRRRAGYPPKTPFKKAEA